MNLNFFKTVKKRPAGAALISYPKSGRTWVRYVFALAGAKVKFSHGGHGTATLEEIGNEYAGLQETVLRQKNILLHRNVLDTAVSLYFQIHRRNLSSDNAGHLEMVDKLKKLGRLPPIDIDEFVLHPIWGCGQISKFNRGWCDYLQNERRALIVKYEDLRKDPSLWFKTLFDFLGCKNYDLDHLVSESSFQKMRAVELQPKGVRKGLRLYGLKDGDYDSLKVRKGAVKGYVEYLRPETIAAAALIAKEYGFDI
jgi:hypothetical protein